MFIVSLKHSLVLKVMSQSKLTEIKEFYKVTENKNEK